MRPEVRGKQRLDGPVPNADLGPGFGSFFGGLPGGKRREGRSRKQRHPDVKAASYGFLQECGVTAPLAAKDR